MSREQVFDIEIKKFFDVSMKILESYTKTFLALHPSTDNHVLRNLQRYRIVYNMTTPDNHIPYFQKLFRSYRDELLDVLKDDKWLVDGNVVIQYGEDFEDEELRKRAEKRKIEVSSIYKCAVQLKKSVEESLRGLPDKIQEQSQELIYPEIFLLHLFRILYSIYPQNKELQRNVQSLEKDLGVISNQKRANPLLENLAESAKQLFGNVLPGNIKIPSNDEMSQKLEQAFKDPVVNETLGATVNSLMSAKNLGEGLGAALKSLENPKFMDGVLKAVQTLIPQETLDTILKSTEQLKESGEVKEALGKLGLPSEIDISKMLNNPEGGGIDLTKILNINHLAESFSPKQSIEQNELTDLEVPLSSETQSEGQGECTQVESEGQSQNQSTNKSQTQSQSMTAVNSTQMTPDKMLQSLLSTLGGSNGDIQGIFSQMMKQMNIDPQKLNQNTTPENPPKSLIDLDI
jgi:hypothetical protein